MPAPKPNGLSTRHNTKAEKKNKRAAESAMKPKTKLELTPPAALKGHSFAGAVWKRMIKLYLELDALIVSKLDEDLLVDYCLVSEQLNEMDDMRAGVMKSLQKARTDADKLKYIEISAKLDSRVDIKRKRLLELRQSLYLTPRSRAGVVPPDKTPEPKKSKMDELIDDEEVEVKPPRSKK